MERERFHQTRPALSFVRAIKFFALAPVESNPALNAVAGHGITHRAETADVKLIAIRRERHREDAAEIVMAFDHAPAREVVGLELRNLFTARDVPNAHFAHEISRGDVLRV